VAGSEAARLIEQLVKRGMVKARIADALGVNSSLVSQIVKGAKPGANLVEPLRALSRLTGAGVVPSTRAEALAVGQLIPAAQRRTTRTGQPARVRQSSRPPGGPAKPAPRAPFRSIPARPRNWLTMATDDRAYILAGARGLGAAIVTAADRKWRLAYTLWLDAEGAKKIQAQKSPLPYQRPEDHGPFREDSDGGPDRDRIEVGVAGRGISAGLTASSLAGVRGDVTLALLRDMRRRGVAVDGSPDALVHTVTGIEVRVWMPDPRMPPGYYSA